MTVTVTDPTSIFLSLSGAKKKGVLAKRVSADSSVTPKNNKYPRSLDSNSTFGTQSATAKRGAHFAKTPFLSWFLHSLTL